MLKTSAAALCALLMGCTSVIDEPVDIRASDDPPPVNLQTGDRITVKATDVSAHVCVDDSRLMCSYGSGRLSYVSCECQRATASPAAMR
jgi:hypothetical protein